MLAVADRETSLIITGNGDVLEPEHGIVAIGSGGAYAQAAARALLDAHRDAARRRSSSASLEIAGDLCIYTNQHHTIEVLSSTGRAVDAIQHDPAGDRLRARPPHRRPARRQARGGDRAAQPLAPPAGRRQAARRDHAEEHPDDRPHRRRQDRDRAPPGQAGATRRSSRSRRPSSPRSATSARDVDSIVRDLADMAVKRDTRSARCATLRARAEDAAEERVLDVLVPRAARRLRPRSRHGGDSTARQVMRKRLREGALDDKEIEIELAEQRAGFEIMSAARHGRDGRADARACSARSAARAARRASSRSPRR